MNDPAEDIRLAALAHALKDIKAGKDVDAVMENMSKVIRAKIMHTIITSVKDIKFEFDIDEHHRKYKEQYLDKHNERPRD
jgi:glutamyl-tRNA reductase